jgi:uncharacterized Zn-binding protein involved in type VI secretion
MGKPAARIGDMTSHGGRVVDGVPTVLIGGLPAAVAGSMHVCPMVTGTVPHVGGTTTTGCSTTVFVGGRPLAVIGSSLACAAGPPGNKIIGGEPSVLVG